MTRTYAMPRVVGAYRETHMPTKELAALCVVGDAVIAKACKTGRVAAIKVGRQWLIPRLDAQVYAAAYIQHNNGETWTPRVERTKRAWRPTNPTKPTTIWLEVPPEMLRAIDAERERRYRETGVRKGNMRANIIFEAIERMLGAR